MNCFRKYSKYFLILIFPAICWLFINSFINGHYHKLSNGEIIYHCHPFKHNNKNNTSPFENHHHTKSEFFILAQISNPLFLMFVILILIGQLIHSCVEILVSENSILLLRNYFYNKNYRSPPAYEYLP
jgi:hypothetical protein